MSGKESQFVHSSPVPGHPGQLEQDVDPRPDRAFGQLDLVDVLPAKGRSSEEAGGLII